MKVTKEQIYETLKERDGEDIFNRFISSTVAVCGLGGLGSNIAISLARAGVGKLIIADFDRVDISNMNRQQYALDQIGMFKTEALYANLKAINPYMEIEVHNEKITEDNAFEMLKDADVICEAFDNADAKAMLLDIVCEKMPYKYFVCASGMAGLHDPNSIKTKKLGSHIYICGDFKSGIEDEALYSSGAMLCASHQAHTILRILAGKNY